MLIGRAEVAIGEGQLALASVDAQDALKVAQSLQRGAPYSVGTGLARLIEGDIQMRTGETAAAQTAFASALDHLTHTVDASHPALKRALALAHPATAAASN